MTVEFTTPVSRLVSGHPLKQQTVTDDNGKPKLDVNGQPSHEYYFALAVAKGQEQQWTQTDWGMSIYQEGSASWPNGEFRAPGFAWKITDGDSQIPNKVGKKPCDREGWSGHWILHLKTSFPISCYNYGRYNPMTDQIVNVKEIKTGDYCRAVVSVKGNNPSKSPGVYLNPTLFELYRAGVEIVSENAPDAATAFGSVPASLPANAQLDNNIAPPPPPNMPGMTAPPPPPPPVQPRPEILQPPKMYLVQGVNYTYEQLKGFNWTDEQIKALS